MKTNVVHPSLALAVQASVPDVVGLNGVREPHTKHDSGRSDATN